MKVKRFLDDDDLVLVTSVLGYVSNNGKNVELEDIADGSDILVWNEDLEEYEQAEYVEDPDTGNLRLAILE